MSMSEIRYAIRSLVRAPGFAIAVILTLGLGIGANTAIFSVVRGVLLKPLPNKNGDRLVYVRQSINGPGGDNILFSVPEITDFRTGAKRAACRCSSASPSGSPRRTSPRAFAAVCCSA
jgi:putative ABC transport system permease protein